MKIKYMYCLAALAVGGILASCSKRSNGPDDNDGNDGGRSKYVFLITSVGSGDESANYIVPVDDVTQGSISTTGTGAEADGYSFIAQHNKIFGLVWGGQGPITPYELNNEGKVVTAGSTINAVTALTYGKVDDDAFVFTSLTTSKAEPNATIMRYDAKNLVLAERNTIDISKVTGTDEVAVFTGVFQVDDDKLYLPYYSVPGVAGQNTKYKDSTWVAVVNYPELSVKTVIRDGRSSQSGFWFCQNSLKQIENGDVYLWSGAFGSKNPSAFMKIAKGTDSFDQEYFFNVEEKTEGAKIVRGTYIADGKFLIALEADNGTNDPERDGGGPARVKLAIADVLAQGITYIDGTPEYEAPWYDFPAFTEDDGHTVRFVLRESAEKYVVYTIDANTATATRGLEITGANVSSINKLTY
ncbi:DUF4374 domain-containing protein [Olivibacter sp. SDN3]|uniref:DUF4374 domain-containing protein n=1 Tax=Olivibacter sp. SDN3 TaxID=2764720 RepID=UPI0016511C8E|nr:DUF4374 domain-containing protein [Olivibacter sp. SDN3]QNL48259.1 DUF4374 domain-containing protein [Olivibacter sp. SDN3]